LKSLLDECIRQRRSGIPIGIPVAVAPVPVNPGGNNGRGRAEAEKNLDRLKRDLSQLVPSVTNKRPRLDANNRLNPASSSSMTPSPTASVPVEEPDDMDLDL
jgi:hypothetical protein